MTVTTYRATRDFKFNGRQILKGDPVKKAALAAVDPSKEGTLLRTRFIELPPQSAAENMNKAELVDFAGTLGVSVSSSWRKDEILEAIESEI